MKNDDSEKVGRLQAAPHYSIKVCPACGQEYQPTGGGQKYCITCSSHRLEAYQTDYQKTHRKEFRAYNATCYKKHAEKNKVRSTLWGKAHPEKSRAYTAARRKAHPDKVKAEFINWVITNPDRVQGIRKKHAAKRRFMGWNPLNAWFVGCDGHHINENDVIYIPRTLHRSVGHDHFTGRGMEQINVLAYQWLTKEEVCRA